MTILIKLVVNFHYTVSLTQPSLYYLMNLKDKHSLLITHYHLVVVEGWFPLPPTQLPTLPNCKLLLLIDFQLMIRTPVPLNYYLTPEASQVPPDSKYEKKICMT